MMHERATHFLLAVRYSFYTCFISSLGFNTYQMRESEMAQNLFYASVVMMILNIVIYVRIVNQVWPTLIPFFNIIYVLFFRAYPDGKKGHQGLQNDISELAKQRRLDLSQKAKPLLKSKSKSSVMDVE